MATMPHTPLPSSAQATYDHLIAQLDNSAEITRESLLSTQQTIARFERAHRMSSVEMQRKLDAGEIDETYDICQWLIELDVLSGLLADLR